MSDPSKELPEETLDALIARERAHVGQPLTEWRTLSAQLREEGLMRSSSEPVEPTRVSSLERLAGLPQRQMQSGGGVWHWSLRFVTSAVLLGIGVFAGLGWSARTQSATVVKDGVQAHVADTVAANATPGDDSTARLVSNSSTEPFASPEVAKLVLLRAESDYQRAAAYLAASDTTVPIAGERAHSRKVYQERLAAIDALMSATRQALKDSPHDPLLHQYYQSTVGAHEATVQQLAQVVPVGMQVSHY